VRLSWVLAEPLTRGLGAAVGCRVVLKTPQYGPSPNKPPPGFKAAEVVGPAGWHLHSFASTAHGLYKMFSRAGHYSSVMHPSMKAKALQHRQHCSEVCVATVCLLLDARAYPQPGSPLTHASRRARVQPSAIGVLPV
jgi:hypothetical protein